MKPKQLDPLQGVLVKHSLIVIFLGLLAGFGLGFNVLGVISLSPIPVNINYALPGEPSQWRALHLGNIMNGLMGVVFALLLPFLALSDGKKKFVSYGLVATIWCNVLFYFFAIFTPNRGLSLTDNSVGEANWAAALAFGPAFVSAFVLMVIVVICIKSIPKE